MTTTATLDARKLRPSDLARLSTVGLRTRKLRAGLSALGIAIGVAAIVAVLGLSSSASAGSAQRDLRPRHQPARGPKRPDPLRPDRRAPQSRPGHDRAHRPVTEVQEDRLGHRRRLPQPAHPHHRHQRHLHRRGQPRPAAHGRHQRGRGQLPQRGDRPRARLPSSAPPPPNASGSTGSSPVSGSGSTTSGSTWPAS
jgi:hypothetical protein